MLRFSSKQLAAFMFGAVVCSSGPVTGRSAPDAAAQGNVFRTARNLLEAAYPEIFGKGYFLKFTTGQNIDNSWRELYELDFKITALAQEDTRVIFSASTGQRLPPEPNPTLLEGQVAFDESGRLLEADLNGPEALSLKENKAFAGLVAAHQEWTDDIIAQEFEKAGGDYPLFNRNALLARVHMERFEEVLGRTKLENVEFMSPSEGTDFAQWRVTVRTASTRGGHPSYELFFEPFGGKLIFLKMKGAVVVHSGAPG